MALPDTLGLLREPKFRLLWIGQATSTPGDGPEPEVVLTAPRGEPAEALRGA